MQCLVGGLSVGRHVDHQIRDRDLLIDGKISNALGTFAGLGGILMCQNHCISTITKPLNLEPETSRFRNWIVTAVSGFVIAFLRDLTVFI